jgi:hypothetical protein
VTDSDNDIQWYRHNCEPKKSDYDELNGMIIWGLKIQTHLSVLCAFPILLDAYTKLFPPNINQVN